MKTSRQHCDLCNSSSDRFINLFEKNGYHIVKCGNCDLIFTLEIPDNEELKKFYDKSYYEGDIYKSYSEIEEGKKRYFIQNLMYFENFHSGKGKILEIGSATGIFLSCANFMGYDATGVEISEYAAKIAVNNNLKVLNKSLEELRNENTFEKNSFDAVFLWDCIEHLDAPLQWLKYLNKCTKPGGLIVLNTLNVSSPTVKYLKKNWSQYFPPVHMFYFSLKTLNRYLTGTGFSIVKLKTEGPLFYDDMTDKYHFLKPVFSNRLVNKITNKLKLGYAQYIVARKVNDLP